jgi:hypothetical protein
MTQRTPLEQDDKSGVSAIPPYVPYKTLGNFLDGIKATNMPSRIDRSVMPSMSGSLQGQLTSALRYLELVTPNGVPTERLVKIVNAEGAEKQKALRELIISAYPFLFKNFDLERATTKQLEEQFASAGANGATVRKCMAFFMGAAKAADIKLSPHLKPFKSVVRNGRNRRTVASGTPAPTNGVYQSVPQHDPGHATWEQLLLSKFPNFDPGWPDDVKTKWFAAFDQLMKQGSQKG